MDTSFLPYIAIIICLILFSGFFSGSETALFSLSIIQREKLKRRSRKSSRIIEKLLEKPGELIVTILIGNDMVNITTSVIAANLFVSLYGKDEGRWVAIAVMTPLTLIFAEIIPKTLFIVHSETFAPFISRPIHLFSKLITPLRWFFDKLANILIRLFGFEKKAQKTVIMEDDFLDMVDLSHEDGELKVSERDLIHNVFEFSDTRVYEIFVPVEDFVSIPHDMTLSNVIQIIKKRGHSRIPVYKNRPENIVGILYVKDLLRFDMHKLKPQARILPQIWRKPFFIRQDHNIDALFYILKEKRIHMSICLNESSQVVGLVTMEDLLEELFGEIYDEYDLEAR